MLELSSETTELHWNYLPISGDGVAHLQVSHQQPVLAFQDEHQRCYDNWRGQFPETILLSLMTSATNR